MTAFTDASSFLRQIEVVNKIDRNQLCPRLAESHLNERWQDDALKPAETKQIDHHTARRCIQPTIPWLQRVY
jgi:hypothetical protein